MKKQKNASSTKNLGSEESFRLLVDSVTDYAIMMIDPDGHIASWNSGAEKILGFRSEEIIGKHFSCFYTSEAISLDTPGSELDLASTQGHFENEGFRKHKDGAHFWANTIITPLCDENGMIFGFSNITRELSDRKKADYTRSLIEASLDPLVTIAPDGKITDVNAATESITGRSRQELIGTDFCEYFTVPEKAREGYQEVFREGQVRDYPLELRHLDGRVTSVLYNASVYRDEDGAVVGVFAAARDITDRKQAEDDLKRATAYTRSLIEASLDPLVTIAPDGKITDVNAATETITGCSRSELIGTDFSNYFTSSEKASDGYRRGLEGPRLNGGTRRGARARRWLGGQYRPERLFPHALYRRAVPKTQRCLWAFDARRPDWRGARRIGPGPERPRAHRRPSGSDGACRRRSRPARDPQTGG